MNNEYVSCITQVSISDGGLPKRPVAAARITRNGVEGDRQDDRVHHGGPDRAVSLFSEELYQDLAAAGVSLSAGQVGENLTTRGLDLLELSPGQRLEIGGCVIELTQLRIPCAKLNRHSAELLRLMTGRAGWMARVVNEGTVRPGDRVVVVDSTNEPCRD
jgi:MOSC domain-containing protein YiiM